MKTPQEQAEEWVKRIDNDHFYSDWRYDREELRNLIERILSESGHAELIAVAQALNEYMDSQDEETAIDRHKKVMDALEALRATGKVEL